MRYTEIPTAAAASPLTEGRRLSPACLRGDQYLHAAGELRQLGVVPAKRRRHLNDAIRKRLGRRGRPGGARIPDALAADRDGGLVDVGVDDNPPELGGLGSGSPDVRPGHVEPGKGRLDQDCGEVSVPAVSRQAERTSPIRLVWTNEENSSSRADRGLRTSAPSVR